MPPPLALNAWLRFDAIQRAFAGIPYGATVLEVGAGEGAVAARLSKHYDVLAIEPDPQSAKIARERITAAGGRFRQCCSSDLPGDQFSVVCAFEVLEHMKDDRAALTEWVSHLAPGGWLILSVPAFEARFGAWDTRAGHYRRYEPASLQQLLAGAGLRDTRIWVTGFPLGNGLEQARNLIGRLRTNRGTSQERTLASGRAYQPPAALGFATAALSIPFRLMQRPFSQTRLGTGLVVRARLA
jgi:SAM-dependent methyltransferase